MDQSLFEHLSEEEEEEEDSGETLFKQTRQIQRNRTIENLQDLIRMTPRFKRNVTTCTCLIL